jgi:hypothetical protein
MRQGCVKSGRYSAWQSVWTNSYTGEETARINFTCNMFNQQEGWLRIQLNSGREQTVILTPRTPPGATHFRCRQGWGRRVAYTSQFLDPDNRAHRGKAKIKARLIGDCDPDEWELPPKPKWMRWRTYNRYVDRFERYEAILDSGVAELMAKLLADNFFKNQ